MSDFQALPDDAVINMPFPHPLLGRPMFKVAEFSSAGVGKINSVHQHPVTSKDDCEVLIPITGNWKKGKFRFRVVVEFCPDQD
jgi:hypothetical protein